MHSRIFQISKETIDVSDYIEASDIPEGFQSGIADYVVDVEDRTAELKCLMESFSGIFVPEPGKDSFRIASNGKKAYFSGGYKRFRELCALMLTTTMEAFIGMEAGPEDKALSFLMYELNEAYSSKYGYYIYEDDELQALPEWLRAADQQAIYHIGNVLDYHF